MTNDREQYYIDLIKTSYSICEVCKKANISITTGNYDTIKKIIAKYNIDISHFKRQYDKKCKPQKIEIDKVLNNEHYISAYKLKKLLIKNGLKEEVCESCGLTEWLGKKIPLQLHHIDGNKYNNNFDNFVHHVYLKMPTPKQYSIQDYSNIGNNYIYSVKYTDDLLATGLTNKEYTHTEEKMTFKKMNDETIEMSVGSFYDVKDIKSVINLK